MISKKQEKFALRLKNEYEEKIKNLNKELEENKNDKNSNNTDIKKHGYGRLISILNIGAPKEEVDENMIKRNSDPSKLSNFDFFEKKQMTGKFASVDDDKSYKKSGGGELNEKSDFEEKVNEEDGDEKKGEEEKIVKYNACNNINR